MFIKRTTNTLHLDKEDINYANTYKHKGFKKDNFLKSGSTHAIPHHP
jgi:hypothetical protein